MPLTDFTSYDQVRAALGVSDEELEDATLALDMYLTSLQVDLYAVDSALEAKYLAIKGQETKSAAEQRFYDLVRLFATYCVANQLASSLPLFAPKDVSDGSDTLGRFSDGPYKEAIAQVKAQYERLYLTLGPYYKDVADTAVTTPAMRTLFSVSSPSSDPVTGS